jgi:hypothetical protein
MPRTRWIVAALTAAAALAGTRGAISAGIEGAAADSEAELAAIGLRIAPVPLDLAGRDRRLVGLGSYLVNLATCSGCHTNPEYAPGHDPFEGQKAKIDAARYLAGGTDFGGVVSANITPDRKGRPAGLDYGQFVRAMRHGADPDHPGQLLQVMPWPAYRYVTEHQLRAIYEYLGAIPSRPSKPAAAALSAKGR